MVEFNWTGKDESIKEIGRLSNAVLTPCTEQSINFETTENLFIEGDNLEVLKLLQKDYAEKVKMIYIDPPYNTGKKFIYNDNFRNRKDKHSKWLSMMYPRLYLAKSLLRDDGVIFISIDDREQHHLRLVCNEIFGEENFVANIIWERKNTVQNDAKHISKNHEYIICYAKALKEINFNLLKRTHEQSSRYKNIDNDLRGPWTGVTLHAKSGSKNSSFTFPNGVKWAPNPGTYCRLNEKSLLQAYNENRIYFGKNGNNKPSLKIYLSEVKNGVVSNSIWYNKEVGSTQNSNKEVRTILKNNVFETPKPLNLILKILRLSTNKEDIVLDFFSGSSTTADAVMQLNAEDNGNRKYIMVQLPEICDEKSEAFKAGYRTIADIGKERIRRAAEKIKLEKPEYKGDLGFKVFKLDHLEIKGN